MTAESTTGRREPPRFRRLELARKQRLGQRMIRVTLAGDQLDGFEIEQPAASVRLLIPSPGSTGLVIPEWNGNEFLLGDGSRPIIRTFTPRAMGRDGLDLDIVLHDGGAASGWAEAADSGAAAAISGPGRGYQIDHLATEMVLVGDETAIPAIGQLIEQVQGSMPVEVHLVVTRGFGRVEIAEHSNTSVTWHDPSSIGEVGDTMVDALSVAGIGGSTAIWGAGEAAAMHRIRTYLFKQLGIPRSQATVRGYWKARH